MKRKEKKKSTFPWSENGQPFIGCCAPSLLPFHILPQGSEKKGELSSAERKVAGKAVNNAGKHLIAENILDSGRDY